MRTEFTCVKLNKTENPDVKIPEVTEEEALKDKDGYVVVSLASKYCLKNNDFYKDQGNKSYPHDGLVCCECKNPVVISDRMFEITIKNKNIQVVCSDCVPLVVEKANENS